MDIAVDIHDVVTHSAGRHFITSAGVTRLTHRGDSIYLVTADNKKYHTRLPDRHVISAINIISEVGSGYYSWDELVALGLLAPN